MSNDSHEMVWGTLFVMIGPGGAGKNSIMRRILEDDDRISQLATATTRAQRDGEAHGREHLFIDLPTFKRMIENDELLEYQEVTQGKFYGIPRASVEEQLKQGRDLIADIEVLGARVLRDKYRDHILFIFIDVPGETDEEKLSVLRQRMSNDDRNEKADLIEERLQRATCLEFPFRKEANFIIVNNDLEQSVHDLKEIIAQNRQKRKDSRCIIKGK